MQKLNESHSVCVDLAHLMKKYTSDTMDLKKLKFFLVLAEELHFGKAAARLNMTQPPLSQAIQSLEVSLGVRLFIRNKRTVSLSPAGKLWLAHAQKLMDDAEQLAQLARYLEKGEKGELKLSFIGASEYSFLPSLLKKFKTLYPQVELILEYATSDCQLERILTSSIDAGFLFLPNNATPHVALAHKPVIREPFVVAIPEGWIKTGHIPISQDAVHIKDIIHSPLILFPRRYGPTYHDIVTSYYLKHGGHPIIVQEAIQMQTIISLVSAELGVSLVPKSITGLKRDGVVYLPLKLKPPEIVTHLVWRQDNPSAALQNLLALF